MFTYFDHFAFLRNFQWGKVYENGAQQNEAPPLGGSGSERPLSERQQIAMLTGMQREGTDTVSDRVENLAKVKGTLRDTDETREAKRRKFIQKAYSEALALAGGELKPKIEEWASQVQTQRTHESGEEIPGAFDSNLGVFAALNDLKVVVSPEIWNKLYKKIKGDAEEFGIRLEPYYLPS